ncbi:MAG: permease-like cell division protein FtsX [Thauera sp.]|jgi:cell division transport system permease protein|nr:permease-like cell division protein FtsX [Thauera sp.]
MGQWLYLHLRAIGHALQRLLTQPVNTLLSALVVGIALSLPGGAFLLLDNVNALARGLSATPELSIFVDGGLEEEALAALELQVGELPDIDSWRFVSRDQALQQLGEGGLGDVISALGDNPLPHAFVLRPHEPDPEQLEELVSRLRQWPGVEHVQLDSAWVARLHALLELGRVLVLMLAGLLGFALIIVTFNTIRLQILTQRQEIEISRLLGATDPFIRRPFYWFGGLQGALGGLVALGTIWLGVLGAGDAVEHLAQTYGTVFRLQGPDAAAAALLIGFAALLGWLGAALSVRRHLAST